MVRPATGAAPELLKLAHQLGVAPERLDFLAGLPADRLRELRRQVGEALFQADRPHFVKVAAASKLMPGAIAAKVTEHALSPLIAARTAEVLDAGRAVDMVGRLSQRYLADVAAVMDPARAPDVVAAVTPATVAAVARELAGRREWVVMGGFVSHVSIGALEQVVALLDGEQLLRVGYVLDDLSRLDDIVAMLDAPRLGEVLGAAVTHGLWSELRQLVEQSAPVSRQRLGAALAVVPAAVSAEVRAAVDDGRLGSCGADLAGAA